MKMPPEVVIVKVDDWEGLYVDGVLKNEGHEVRLSWVLEAFGLPPARSLWADEKWLEEAGSLPALLSDVKAAS